MKWGWVLGVLVLAGPARGNDLLDLQTCLNIYVDRYEWDLDMNRDVPIKDVEGGLWKPEHVANCVTMGIMICDEVAAPLECQRALADEADALTAAIEADLPEPGADDGFAARVYEQAHAAALGQSAGPDCAGSTEPMTAWCGAHEAGLRLRDAVLAWQVARYLGQVPSGVEAGWAGPPPPIRPQPRPENGPENL